jgi:hypothetical protein
VGVGGVVGGCIGCGLGGSVGGCVGGGIGLSGGCDGGKYVRTPQSVQSEPKLQMLTVRDP